MAEVAPQPCGDPSSRFVQLVERTAMTLIEWELRTGTPLDVEAAVARVSRDFGRAVDLWGCEAALTDRLVSSLETRLPRARPREAAQPSRPVDGRSPTPENRDESP
jgi:hypothetical protein